MKITRGRIKQDIVTKTNSHGNQIHGYFIILALSILTIKIVPTTNFYVEYLHIVNLNYLRYLYFSKPNLLYSRSSFSNFAYHDNLGSIFQINVVSIK